MNEVVDVINEINRLRSERKGQSSACFTMAINLAKDLRENVSKLVKDELRYLSKEIEFTSRLIETEKLRDAQEKLRTIEADFKRAIENIDNFLGFVERGEIKSLEDVNWGIIIEPGKVVMAVEDIKRTIKLELNSVANTINLVAKMLNVGTPSERPEIPNIMYA